MTNNNKKPIVIGVGGFARCGKDTFVKVAKNILKENGYSCAKLAFADPLKEELDPFLLQHYNISAWTENNEEKKLIRPYLTAHGCGKRLVSNGTYWINKAHEVIEKNHQDKDVVFVSDCRFPNEADWIHNKWNGWFVHLKKYSLVPAVMPVTNVHKPWDKVYDKAPNGEEAENDPLCAKKADYHLELENVTERTLRETGNKINPESLVDNSYLINEITACLINCPSLTIQSQPKAKSFWSNAQSQTKIVSLETR